VDENQEPSAALPPNGHPSFLRFTVLLVKDGNGQGIQEELGSPLEGDPVLAQVLLRLDGVPLESVTQRSPPPAGPTGSGAQARPAWHLPPRPGCRDSAYLKVPPSGGPQPPVGPTHRILSLPVAALRVRGAARSLRPATGGLKISWGKPLPFANLCGLYRAVEFPATQRGAAPGARTARRLLGTFGAAWKRRRGCNRAGWAPRRHCCAAGAVTRRSVRA
jgi:hypothetical protein